MDEDTGMIRIEIIVKDDADVNEASNTQGTIDDPLHYYSVEFLMISSSWSTYYSGSYCLALLLALELQIEKFSCQYCHNPSPSPSKSESKVQARIQVEFKSKSKSKSKSRVQVQVQFQNSILDCDKVESNSSHHHMSEAVKYL